MAKTLIIGLLGLLLFGCAFRRNRIQRYSIIETIKTEGHPNMKAVRQEINDSSYTLTMYYNDTARSYCKITQLYKADAKHYDYVVIDFHVREFFYKGLLPRYVININDDVAISGRYYKKQNMTSVVFNNYEKPRDIIIRSLSYYDVFLDDFKLKPGIYVIEAYLEWL